MNIFLDTSVVLRVLFREPDPIPDWGDWDAAYASRLWHIEALRVLDRMRLMGAVDDGQVAHLRSEIERVHQSLHILPVSDRVLARAGESFATAIGTLDALHLASALLLRESGVRLDALLTHDEQLATAAMACGLCVRGV